MTTIKIDKEKLKENIEKLVALKQECDEILCVDCGVKGSGEVVETIKAIDNIYIPIQRELSLMIDNTVLFLTNIKDSFADADETASSNIGR